MIVVIHGNDDTKKRVISSNCLHLRLELDSTYNGFQRAQRSRSEAGGGFCIETILCPRHMYLVVSEPAELDSMHNYTTR